jgi:hypothetical protein
VTQWFIESSDCQTVRLTIRDHIDHSSSVNRQCDEACSRRVLSRGAG